MYKYEMEQTQESGDQLAAYRAVYPDCSDEELVEIRDTLAEYLAIVTRIRNSAHEENMSEQP